MALTSFIQSSLVTPILLINLMRLLFYFRFGSQSSVSRLELTFCISNCISFLVLSGALWSGQSGTWIHIWLWTTSISPSLQAVSTTQFDLTNRAPRHLGRLVDVTENSSCIHWSPGLERDIPGGAVGGVSRLPMGSDVVFVGAGRDAQYEEKIGIHILLHPRHDSSAASYCDRWYGEKVMDDGTRGDCALLSTGEIGLTMSRYSYWWLSLVPRFYRSW
ncbi:hypothetical protein N7540_011078 [Penicillium herquei]|nr:hypothetical protein N7540_011078 [Penicillium herquei]